MKRIIIDFNKLSVEHKRMFYEKYPRAYSKNNAISFKNRSGELIEALELITEDTVYLVKVSKVHKPYKNVVIDETDISFDFETYENIEEILRSTDAKSSDNFESELEAV